MEIKDSKLAIVPVLLSLTGLLMLAYALTVTQIQGSGLVTDSDRALLSSLINIKRSGRGLLISAVVVKSFKPSPSSKPMLTMASSVNKGVQSQLVISRLRTDAQTYQSRTLKGRRGSAGTISGL